MRYRFLLVLSGMLFCSTLFSAEEALTTLEQKFSYGLGFQIASDLKQKNIKVETDVFLQGIKDVLTDAPLKISTDEIRATFEAYQAKQMEEYNAIAEKNKKAGEEFLAKNKKEKGVVTLESGLQYKIIKDGQGKKPLATDTVTVNYRGALINGKEFDSSYQRGTPATFSVNGIIKGWQEALPLMKEGAKWQVFIPAELGYGLQGGPGGGIGPNETLIFDIELIGIKEAEEAATAN